MVILTEKSFNGYIKSNDTVVVKFGANWCAPCTQLKPVFNALNDTHNENFAEVDVDISTELAYSHHIVSLPTIVKYVNGEEVGRVIGAKPRSVIEKELGLE